jgi:hypothetical protein
LKLRELAPRFLIHARSHTGVVHAQVDTLELAQGISFLCPRCFQANNGPIGTHRVLCWSRSRGAPDDALPGPGRWRLTGTGIDDLSLRGELDDKGKEGARSVQLTGGCRWHGHITNGEVTFAK